MSELTYKTVEKEGIEFYVSNDGEQTGMSLRGLSRCSGVSRQSVLNLFEGVNKSDNHFLKPFEHKLFINVEGVDNVEFNAKVVSSDVCAKVIQYYAYESKNASNSTAKETLGKFAMVGIDNWIKKITGFDNEDETINKLDQILNILIPQNQKIEKMESELTLMRPIVEEYNVVKDGIHTSFRGLETLIEHITHEDEHLQLVSGNTYTLSEWLETKHIHMEYANLRKFGRTVAETFKSCTVSSPGKKNVKKKNGKWSCNCTAYGEEHFPILEMALNQFMSN